MAATVSLDNMTFWVPPAVAVPECASRVKQQEHLLSQPEYSSLTDTTDASIGDRHTVYKL
ncbi:hypothetical protein RRF57_008334 [Xylaria bambusicola]|uniref:Uncharacterized protein n=1 Tax=Xylaria bambusicola TaxID=326684 RepID=A0AAN7UHJ9_9PEZI